MVTVPWGAMDTKASGLFTVPCGMPAAPHFGASAAASRDGSKVAARTRPVVERMPFRTPGRLTFSTPARANSRMCWVMSRSRSLLDGGANALIRATTADVAEHGVVDVRVIGMRRLLEKRRGLHDLSRLALAALRHVEVAPSLLNRQIALALEPLDAGIQS